MILDHTPTFVPNAGKGVADAYAIGYMRALAKSAVLETEEYSRQHLKTKPLQ